MSPAPVIRTKRVYDPSSTRDGPRILVDRLWPRGLSKEKAKLSMWARECAPSDALRKWYRHEPDKWETFRERYFAELDANPDAVGALVGHVGGRSATFVFSSKERDLNNARALKEYLEENGLL